MRPVRPPTRRLPIHLLALVVLLLPTASFASLAPDEPEDLGDLLEQIGETPAPPWAPEADPCACLIQLRNCLFSATLNLGRCVASLPAGDAICYIKYEIDILLCIHQADICASTCIP